MGFQTVFRRYEIKYILTLEQKERILAQMLPHMCIDQYGKTTVRNLYFDTDSYRLIRRSIEKPSYKEKLRIRSYAQSSPHSTVFVELKKKYEGVVYKRRVPLCEQDAMQWVCQGEKNFSDTQISREIDYFINFYGSIKPKVFLSYEREAYFDREDRDFRVTFDEHILSRCEDVSLRSSVYGTPLLEEGTVLMELKCSGGIPLWMTALLSREHAYKTSFSKYGAAYEQLIFPQIYLPKSMKQKENFSYGCNLSGNF